MSEQVNRILAALLAICAALRADIGSTPMPDDVRAYVGWLLTGAVAGLTLYLGPQIADAVKAALTGNKASSS